MNFQTKHLIYPVRQKCNFMITPVFPVQISSDSTYTLSIRPFSGLRKYGLKNTSAAPTLEEEAFFAPKEKHLLSIQDNALVLDLTFPQEDCYICFLYLNDELVQKLEVYALESDLFALSPFKGDHHIHTYFSDGKDSPMYMAAASCRHGYDYCVITDHYTYEPSLIAKNFFEPTGVDFLVIPGEEVHSPDNPVHIINLGGDFSINAWWKEDDTSYRQAVAAQAATMTDPMTDEDRFAAAACQVIFDRIKAANGVSVLCHPQWILEDGFNEHEDITDYLFDHKRFDALELIAGGAYEVGTQMQISYYKDRPAMPILGNSDTHNCFGAGRLEPGNYTITFADTLSCESIKDAILQGHTVACDANRFFGDYRLVKYAYFLQRNYFPTHKKKRDSLGAKMLRLASSMQGPDSDMGKEVTQIRPSEDFAPLRYPCF